MLQAELRQIQQRQIRLSLSKDQSTPFRE